MKINQVTAVSLSADGQTVAIGAYQSNDDNGVDSGHVHPIFQRVPSISAVNRHDQR